MFGRRTGQIKVYPLDYYDAAKFYPKATIGNKIVGFTKLTSNLVSKYLVTLQDLNYIERIIPFDTNPLKGKTSQYQITENFLAFWYRFVFPYRNEIENGESDVFFDLALQQLSEFVGHAFEDITRQYLRRANRSGKLPFVARSYGNWWGKDTDGKLQEIDVIVESVDKKELLIGECKWQNSFHTSQVTQVLQAGTEIFDRFHCYPYLFTKKSLDIKSAEIVTISVDQFFDFT